MSGGSGEVSRYERDGSTLRFGSAGSRTAVSIYSARIVRIDLEVEGQPVAPSHLESRTWAGARFEIIDGEPLRVSTADLKVEVATDPVRLAFLDSAGAGLLHEPIDGAMSAERLRDGSSRRVRAVFSCSRFFAILMSVILVLTQAEASRLLDLLL